MKKKCEVLNMETRFNYPVCKSEFKVEVVNPQSMKRKSNSSLNDAMVIVNICSEKVRELNKRKTKATINTYPERTKKAAGRDFAECILIDNPLPMLANKQIIRDNPFGYLVAAEHKKIIKNTKKT